MRAEVANLQLKDAPMSFDICLFIQLELTEVAALCEVQGMNSPLVVSIMTSRTKTLSVSYSLPSVW